jgi:cytochrome c oxidase cbb3-type subunit 3
MDVLRTLLFTSVIVCAVGCGPMGGPQTPEDQVREGGQLYTRYCALCHGDQGQGYAADNATRLRGEGFLRTASDELLEMAIARGRLDTAMAAYRDELGGPLNEGQIEAIVAFIRTWQVGDPIPVDDVSVDGNAQRAEPLYAERCAGCHGALGEGGSAQSLSSFAFLSTASDGFLRYAIVHGREQTPMPAFGEELEDQQIDDLVALLRRWEVAPEQVPQHMRPPALADIEVLRYPDGPRPQLSLRDDRFVSAAQIRDAVEARSRIILLDARPTSDWLRRRLPGAVPVPYYAIDPIVERLPRDGTWIIAYCGCPHAASGTVVDRLREAGFENTAILDEGVHHWIEEGYPVETGPLTP